MTLVEFCLLQLFFTLLPITFAKQNALRTHEIFYKFRYNCYAYYYICGIYCVSVHLICVPFRTQYWCCSRIQNVYNVREEKNQLLIVDLSFALLNFQKDLLNKFLFMAYNITIVCDTYNRWYYIQKQTLIVLKN